MSRIKHSIIGDFQTFVGMRKWKTLDWSFEQTVNTLSAVAAEYDASMILNALHENGWKLPLLAALGIHAEIKFSTGQKLDRIQEFVDTHQDYIFGHFGYNVKSATEGVGCSYEETDGFPIASFFVPKIVVAAKKNGIQIGYFSEEELLIFLEKSAVSDLETTTNIEEFSLRTPRHEYLSKVNSLLSHIHRGDIYEINFCVEFFSKATTLNVPLAFEKLRALTLAPFGGMYKWNNAFLLCGSPELYLRKAGNRIISQPIKGTRKRSADVKQDTDLREELFMDQKERSENIMIVDLVRNDLSKVAQRGSVQVTELFGITSFKTVHQMSSTIECKVEPAVTLTEIIGATFPMGSMTGAPKISAMQLAEKYEDQSRGIYSGCIGYIDPEGDFEFNVVIRSIMWNSETGHLSVKAGSAITAKSIPVKEYEECLLKAEAMMNALKTARV
jgi:para-aminobenzoate synthetase component 1